MRRADSAHRPFARLESSTRQVHDRPKPWTGSNVIGVGEAQLVGSGPRGRAGRRSALPVAATQGRTRGLLAPVPGTEQQSMGTHHCGSAWLL